jgi:hypothetical protein
MFSAEQFRAKAREYTSRMKDTVDSAALRELHRLERSFTWLANNEDWPAHRVENSLRCTNSLAAEDGADKEPLEEPPSKAKNTSCGASEQRSLCSGTRFR